MATAIRSSLQKTIFQPDDERLIAVAHIKHDNNKKRKREKEIFVCLVVSIEQPVVVRLYFLKADKDDVFRKKQQFALRDVKVIDGINPRKPITDFNMIIGDKEYQLSTSLHSEKESFIRQLYNLANSYLPVQKPEFINLSLPIDLLVPQNVLPEATDEVTSEVTSDYQPISAEEEADFRQLLAKSGLEVGKARQFANVLNQQLLQLDGANIESIMGSEQNVTDLINLIDGALDEATKIEKQLDEYDNILSYVRDSVELIEEKDSLGQIERTNTRKLMKELSDFLYLMDTINENHINVLKNVNLSDPASINLCCQAARVINSYLVKKTDLSRMTVYVESTDMLKKVVADFVDKLYFHVIALFENMATMIEAQNWSNLIMQKHSQRHRSLLPFSDLIYWLKQARPQVYQNVIDRYKLNAEPLYEREFNIFFKNLSQTVDAERNSTLSTSNEAIFLKYYTDLLDTIICEAKTIVESEQKFCVRFFHINADFSNEENNLISDCQNDALLNAKAVERQTNEKIKSVILPIFDSIPLHVQKFISLCKEHHSLIVTSMFVSLTKKLNSFQDTSSYFPVLYGSVLVNVKRLFDEQMKFTESTFMNIKISKKTRVGILDTIYKLKSLIRSTDLIFGVSERRNDLDKWHEKLTDAVIVGINQSANSPNSKYPATVVCIENFHALRDVLSELKIDCLESRRKVVNKVYQENIDAYVKTHMAKPLDKINIFFEQIERLIKNGKKPEEISYEQQFSRMELKKVIAGYPAREVKKGLENLYRQIEKHLCLQSPLVEVIWRNMQNEFLNQVKHYQQLIAKCYPSPRIDLEFSIQEVLQFCSEIAQQH